MADMTQLTGGLCSILAALDYDSADFLHPAVPRFCHRFPVD